MPCPANELGIVEPFVAIENSNANAGGAVSVDGACVLVARSGTACRAPTGKATTRTKNVVAAAPSIGDRRVKY